MNNTIKKFLESQGVDVNSQQFLNSAKLDYDHNGIVKSHGIYKEEVPLKISVSKVRSGNDTFPETSLEGMAEALGCYFNENGSGYEKRSLGMLEYSSEEIVDQLESSFTTAPMSLYECGQDSYEIGYNGMHRYHILKFHYLKELLSIDYDDKAAIEELDKKYSIEYMVRPVDYIKTYCAYFLDRTKQCDKITVENELVNYAITDKAIVRQVSGQEIKSEVMDNAVLIATVRKQLNKFLENDTNPQVRSFMSIWSLYINQIENLREFLVTHMPEVIEKINAGLTKEQKESQQLVGGYHLNESNISIKEHKNSNDDNPKGGWWNDIFL